MHRFSRPDWLSQSVAILLVGSFLSSMSVFLVAPYMLVYLTREQGMPATLAAAVIGVSYWLLRGGGLLATPLVNRFGYRNTMLYGGGLRIPGYALLLCTNPVLITIGLCLVGIGGGFYFPPSKALLLKLVTPEHQLSALSLRNITANVGVAIGPLIGTVGAQILGFHTVVATTAIAFIILAIIVTKLPSIRPTVEQSDAAMLDKHKRQTVRQLTLKVGVLSLAIGALLTQVETLLPQFAIDHNATSVIGVVFTINAVLVVTLQKLAVSTVKLSVSPIICAIAVLIAFSVLAIPWPPTLNMIISIIMISVVEVIAIMSLDDGVRKLAESQVTLAYGISGMIDGLGGTLAASVVLFTYTEATSNGNALPTLAALGILYALTFIAGMKLLHSSQSKNTDTTQI